MDCDPVLWKIAPHTTAKHTILKRYIEAWAPILSQSGRDKKLVYIDGFAGPGEYEDGEDGSPVVVLKALKNHSRQKDFKAEFVNVFIEICNERAQHLQDTIRRRVEPLPPWIKYDIDVKDFNQDVGELIRDIEAKGLSLAPALSFVDPFGWKDLNYDILSDLMKFNKGELLITFMAGFLERFVWDKAHLPSIKQLFSDEQIETIQKSANQEKSVMELFLANLTSKIAAKTNGAQIWHLAFSAYNANNRLEYYLIYLTKSCAGFVAMKSAMYNVSSDASYKFSDFDFDPSQKTLVNYGVEERWIDLASKEVMENLEKLRSIGLTSVPVSRVKNFIKCSTVWKFNNAILQKLEKEGKIRVIIPDRIDQTFPDRGYITIA